jgi:diguanylate cyclase (GGDEF)-like protein
MKKKTRTAGRKAPKPRKSAVAARKSAGRVASTAPRRPPAAANGARETLRRLKAELARAQARIEQLEAFVETDFLLDIANRRGFERQLNRALSYIKRYQTRGALIVLDVDRLKPINDSFGHAAGDEVLKAVVAAISGQIRSSDVIGRLGGDEFAVLLWNLSETDAKAKASLLEQAIDRLTFAFRGRMISAGASAGVAVLDSRSTAQRALEEADSAMYVRKAQRRHEAAV